MVTHITGQQSPSLPGTSQRPTRWWRRPWVLPLGLVLGLFIAARALPYAFLDPARATVPLNPAPTAGAWHFALLSLHVLAGSIAYITVVLQVWPWLRRRHPAAHRWSGRLYVFAGMLPTTAFAVAIVPVTELGTVAKVGTVVFGLLGFVVTLTGWRLARRRLWDDHRRFMLVSFAIATGVVTGRLLATLCAAVPGLGFDTSIGYQLGAINAFWAGWVINVGLVLWWLRRHAAPRP